MKHNHYTPPDDADFAAQRQAFLSQWARGQRNMFPPPDLPDDDPLPQHRHWVAADYAEEPAEGREWLARHPLSAARQILTWLLIVGLFVVAFVGFWVITG